MTDLDVQRELRAACWRLGLRPTGPDGLRYDFATRLRACLLQDGFDAEAADRQVSRQLGHRRAGITTICAMIEMLWQMHDRHVVVDAG